MTHPVRHFSSIANYLYRPIRWSLSHLVPIHDLRQHRKLVEVELETVFRAIDGITLFIDENDTVVWISPRARSVLDYGESTPTGRSVPEVFTKHPDIQQYLERSRFDEPLLVSAENITEPVLQLKVIPYGHNRKLLIAQEETLIRHLHSIRQDFVVNVSHEMRTPLTVLFGYLEAMVDSAELSHSNWKSIIETMYAQTYRMQHIVDRLLSLAQLENINDGGYKTEIVEVERLLTPLIIEANHLSGKSGHVIETRYSGSTRYLCLADDLTAIMSNLIINAVKYTPAGGRITVEWAQTAREATFEVTDTGIGIAKRYIPRLTERFYRVDEGRSRDIGGTGLGLSIVKHAVNRMGGWLEIESQPGRGSTFRCRFPVDATII